MAAAGGILVVEDDATVLSLLRRVLETEGYQVRALGAAGPALEQCRQSPPDLALIDLGLGEDGDGLSLIRSLRELFDLPVVIVSGATEPEDIQAGCAAGANMYVEKPFVVEKLLARVAGLLGGRREPAAESWKVSDLVIDAGGRRVVRAGRSVDLSRREFDLLCVLARRSGRVMTKSQLLSEVWGYQAYGDNVVERRISSLRQRLEANGPRLIHTVWGCGYVLRA